MSLTVVVIEPQIPPNTGNIARLCAATDTSLQLIEPLGFSLDDDQLRRAGLDYWNEVDLWVHPSWREFRAAVSRDRCLYFSAHGGQSYFLAPFSPNSVLVFGNETMGLPARIREKHPERVYRIPMRPAVRSLNLATAVGIVLYEALRRVGAQLEDRTPPTEAPTERPGRPRRDRLHHSTHHSGRGEGQSEP
ncbi:MAG: tRNA (cytidine(34)-2'-O)-methyltransferase [Gemmatimonadetes bacterium]|nr:tRNA (cytidine(34)-2'-O)-methyltransferase [Gemmatimonadota bacterium]MBI2537513.1 tRNA (cytidine(34)-2'-O)-methyltransferase [Gemmatimonadota bacterium]MBI3082477.1 tRNA (cytidine(34)-2'-O)-methyltransferase [Gemmatimonadota bacterium]